MDVKTSSGLWLLPTRGRARTNLPRFFEAAKKTGMTTPVVVVVDETDYLINRDDYDALDIPDNCRIEAVGAFCCAEATEKAREIFCKGASWIGWLADDLIPETPGWDVKCIESLTGWNCVSTDDGKLAPNKFNGATVWSGDLVRAVGYLYPPGLQHFYIDDVWETLGRMMNIWTCRMDIMVRHVHASWNPDAADETTGHTNSFWQNDEPVFLKWKNDGCLNAANRIGDLLVKYGVSKPLPDLTGVHLLIGVPSGSGRYERLFVESLFSTIEAVRQCKAEVNLVELPYCSDIALARNKLFGTFLRSSATHMLFIDDDMAWRAVDVLKLLELSATGRDFVAVAGPRKVFPPSFAVQVNNDVGKPTPIRQDSGTGLIEVTHIGMAFSLITHRCAERVAGANTDLEFTGDDGRIDYAVFNPLVVNRRYYSEDYAFCHRWRALGGKIHCDPTISLKHVGTFVWQGSWQDHLIEVSNNTRAVA